MSIFAAWGRFVHRRKWLVLAGSLLLLGAVAGAGFGFQGQLNNTSHVHLQSQKAADLVSSQLPKTGSGGSSFEIVFSSPSLAVTDPAYQAAVEKTLQPLRADSRVGEIQDAYSAPSDRSASYISHNGREMLAVVTVKDRFNKARLYFDQVRSEIHGHDGLTTYVTGGIAIGNDFDTYLAADLTRAETTSIPVSLILLLIVFGTLVAALLPVGVGAAAVVGGVAGTLLLARFTDVSTYALNIVTLVGLGVAIDYSLFIVNRYREELEAGATTEQALERSMATAGRAVTFSGLTVAIGLAGMLFYPGTFLVSMGVAGSIVVALAVIFALTLLPAVLGITGSWVSRLHIWRFGRVSRGGFWKALADWVMKRPLVVLVPTLGLILLAASPFFQIKIANGDEHMLPPQAPSRQGADLLARDFPGRDQNTFVVVADYRDGLSLTKDRVDQLYDYGQALASKPNVIRVNSAFSFSSSLSRQQYEGLLTGYQSGQTVTSLPPDAQQLLPQSLGKNIAVFFVETNQPTQSDAAISTLKSLRDGSAPPDSQVLVTGATAFNQDFVDLILLDSPAAIVFVILVTYVVLFLLVGSVVLPLKAVLTNLLSISASFGMLVWVFQQGHLSGLLNFTPQAIDPTVPVIMFCIVFGLSMDYEVMLLSRIQEVYRKTGDNLSSVAEGLERSGRIISGAAGIMIVVFLAFGLAQVLIIKGIGIGLATAVVIDATLMRMLIVPSVMRLLGNLNWWAPHPLARLHAWLRLGEVEATPRQQLPVEA